MTENPSSESAILFRVSLLEQQIKQVQEQLRLFVPARENELQLQNIQTTVSRIERDVIEIRGKLEAQEKDIRERDAARKESLDALQINVLRGIVLLVIGAGISIFTGYITHILH